MTTRAEGRQRGWATPDRDGGTAEGAVSLAQSATRCWRPASSSICGARGARSCALNVPGARYFIRGPSLCFVPALLQGKRSSTARRSPRAGRRDRRALRSVVGAALDVAVATIAMAPATGMDRRPAPPWRVAGDQFAARDSSPPPARLARDTPGFAYWSQTYPLPVTITPEPKPFQ